MPTNQDHSVDSCYFCARPRGRGPQLTCFEDRPLERYCHAVGADFARSSAAASANPDDDGFDSQVWRWVASDEGHASQDRHGGPWIETAGPRGSLREHPVHWYLIATKAEQAVRGDLPPEDSLRLSDEEKTDFLRIYVHEFAAKARQSGYSAKVVGRETVDTVELELTRRSLRLGPMKERSRLRVTDWGEAEAERWDSVLRRFRGQDGTRSQHGASKPRVVNCRACGDPILEIAPRCWGCGEEDFLPR